MPELPEVETTRRGLEKQLVQQRIAKVKVLRSLSIGYPTPKQFEQQLTNHKFISWNRRGKYLLAQLDQGASLVIHLGMSGRLLLANQNTPSSPHVRVSINLDSHQQLYFDDPRVFGRLWYIPSHTTPEAIIRGLSNLGPEPLEHLTAKYLQTQFAKRKVAVKTVLLDQHVIAGIGNIYADESLFKAGINPLTESRELSLQQLQNLVKAIKEIIQNAIKSGGTTLRNYTDSHGVNGNYQHQTWVYGRTNHPCRRCHTPIQREYLSGRSTHFCANCQK